MPFQLVQYTQNLKRVRERKSVKNIKSIFNFEKKPLDSKSFKSLFRLYKNIEDKVERWRLWRRRKNNASAVENDRHNDYPVFEIILKDFIKNELLFLVTGGWIKYIFYLLNLFSAKDIII